MVSDEGIKRFLAAWVVGCVGQEELPRLAGGQPDHVAISKRAAELRPFIPPMVTIDQALAMEANRE